MEFLKLPILGSVWLDDLILKGTKKVGCWCSRPVWLFLQVDKDGRLVSYTVTFHLDNSLFRNSYDGVPTPII